MPHPIMFDEGDPLLHRVRALALAFPGAAEKVSHGRPAFYTTKVFAYFGWSKRVDGGWEQRPRTVVVLPDDDERVSLLQDDRFFSPAYLGAAGWVAFDLPAVRASKNAWAEVGELIDASYRNTAGKGLIAELEARG